MNTEMHTARILTRKVLKSGSEGLAWLLALVGIFLMLFAWWPIGLLCIIGAFFAGAKYEQAHYCPVCGNDVAPTSRLCPTCNNKLAAADTSPGESSRVVLIALLVVVVIVTVFFLLVSLPSPKAEKQTFEQSAEERQSQAKAAKAEREQREQMAREIAARSESIDPKVKAALEQAKAEIDAAAPKSPPGTFDLNNPAPPSLYSK